MNPQVMPKIGKNVFIAPTAYVGGQVELADDVTVMHHVTLRGDVAPIRIGARVNVQDGTVIHTRTGEPLDIQADTAVGHRAVVHCRRVGAGSLIGIGAILLDGVEVGAGSIVASGCVIPPETIIPPHSVVMGVPGRIVRQTDPSDGSMIAEIVRRYVELGRIHAAGAYPNIAGA